MKKTNTKEVRTKIKTVQNLIPVVKKAGLLAFREQFSDHTERTIKKDGSFVTLADKKVENFLVEEIRNKYPEVNIISEETDYPQKSDLLYTFVLDPIDGTDTYSQGMPEWCISIGLLDQNYLPIAGIIYSYSLKLLFFADIEKSATINGKTIEPSEFNGPIINNTNIMVPSSIHKQIDLTQYPGKIRSIGSAALHLCFPLIYPGIFATIESQGNHIWDIVGAHAINRSLRLDVELFDGRKINYEILLDGRSVGDTILAGTSERIAILRKLLHKIT